MGELPPLLPRRSGYLLCPDSRTVSYVVRQRVHVDNHLQRIAEAVPCQSPRGFSVLTGGHNEFDVECCVLPGTTVTLLMSPPATVV